eukprot:CAMPEP_0196674970 /NCGR_PEP_ID=MMETSP1090-20130531/3780_1 /TAXON_ID=37098 /ORGANISM="Isochrysis sp, Strain CCMP1244" /LENGTH=198 /DNA_ID=CAMNT_0042012777 /DNA_START=47 /DNA_END=645 /DNA_ORIENTATION=-
MTVTLSLATMLLVCCSAPLATHVYCALSSASTCARCSAGSAAICSGEKASAELTTTRAARRRRPPPPHQVVEAVAVATAAAQAQAQAQAQARTVQRASASAGEASAAAVRDAALRPAALQGRPSVTDALRQVEAEPDLGSKHRHRECRLLNKPSASGVNVLRYLRLQLEHRLSKGVVWFRVDAVAQLVEPEARHCYAE